MKGFYKDIKKPFFALAPMADVTDASFRRMFAKYGKPLGGPDVLWTEFVSADGLFLGGGHILQNDLRYTEEERPIVAQFFSKDPELMKQAAKHANDLGFDGIDINMGCPARVICNQGAGAAMIKDPEGAKEIIRATKEGAGDLPVSVKTRTGFSKDEVEEWVPALLEEGIDVLILHGRTRRDMSKVPARWETIKRAVEIRDEMGVDTLIVGNGDVTSMEEVRARVEETGCDGVMVGRGAFGNPWFFTDYTPTIGERLKVLVEHSYLYEELLGEIKPFAIMKKHFKAYVSGWDGAKELRTELMACNSASEAQEVIERYTKRYPNLTEGYR